MTPLELDSEGFYVIIKASHDALEVVVSSDAIDIGSIHEGLAGRLSNFTRRQFVFRGVHCASIEGVLQAVKFRDAAEQVRVCGLAGREAKQAGKIQNRRWQSAQILHWQGVEMARESQLYTQFLEDLFVTVAEQCPDFRDDLLATGDAKLKHSMGRQKKSETVLTEEEFCWLLTFVRRAVKSGVIRERPQP